MNLLSSDGGRDGLRARLGRLGTMAANGDGDELAVSRTEEELRFAETAREKEIGSVS